MAQSNLCRLCVDICEKPQSLYDENGFGNEWYEIIVKYFHPTILNMDKWKELTHICLPCWRQIWDFENYRKSVIKAQKKLLEKDEEEVFTEMNHDHEPIHTSGSEVFDDLIAVKVEGEFITVPELEAIEACDQRTGNLPENITPCLNEVEFISLPEFESIDDSCKDDEPTTSRCGIKEDVPNIIIDSAVVVLSDDECEWEEEEEEEEQQGNDTNDNYYQFESDDDDGAAKPQPTDNISQWEGNPSNDDESSARTKRTREGKNEELDELMNKLMPIVNCDLCSESCSSWPSLQEHFRQKHPFEECYIPCCGRKLKEHWTLKEHLRFHNNPSIFKCHLCDKRHSTKCSLKRHMDVHHPETREMKWLCKVCDKAFTTNGGLKYHVTTVHDTLVQTKRLKLPDGMVLHLCNHCGKTFPNLAYARRHIWYNHRFSRVFQCELCPKSYRRPRLFREHMAAHNGKHLYACSFCPSTFTYRNSLQAHRKAKHPAHENDDHFYTLIEES